MVQINDAEYQKLKKDADDNRSILFIVKCIAGLVLTMLLYFTVGQPIINSWINSYQESIRCDIETMKARNSVLIREIQSKGLTTEEYLEWYKIYSETN